MPAIASHQTMSLCSHGAFKKDIVIGSNAAVTGATGWTSKAAAGIRANAMVTLSRLMASRGRRNTSSYSAGLGSETLRSFAAFAPDRRNLGINLLRSQTIKSLFVRVPLDALERFRSRRSRDSTDTDLFLF
jgi:hypothetical protein